MSKVLDTFKKFLEDDTHAGFEMFIYGQAGTGKTTSLEELVSYCLEEHIPAVSVAFTHKACLQLIAKLPEKADVQTLHKFLKKRPGINMSATNKKRLQITTQFGKPEPVRVIFVDEFSMVGDSDYASLGELQDPEYEGVPVTKIVYIGDPMQLPPVKGAQAVSPQGKYTVSLNKVYRTDHSDLLNTLTQLRTMYDNYVQYQDKSEIKPLGAHDHLVRNCKELPKADIYLAYTNKRVQELNQLLQGRKYLEVGDEVFDATRRLRGKVIDIDHTATSVSTVNGELTLGMKFEPLEFINSLSYVKFVTLALDEGDEETIPVIFGTHDHKKKVEELAEVATEYNNQIELKYRTRAKTWAAQNNKDPLARKRAKAWREYLSVNDYVHCLDFDHAMTIHKSQGATYEKVFVDLEDLNIVKGIDLSMFMRLLYVAVSRASSTVYMNQ